MLIKLDDYQGRKFIINTEHITTVFEDGEGMLVVQLLTSGVHIIVESDIESFFRLIKGEEVC
jgi:uncharacterized protein YlzI (FlbEa/FlbD family)